MQTNFLIKYRKNTGSILKERHDKIIEPNVCNFVKSVLGLSPALPSKFDGALRRFSISLKPKHDQGLHPKT